MARPRGRQGETENRLLALLHDGVARSQRELMAELGVTSRGTITRLLGALREEQMVQHGFSLSPAAAKMIEEA